MSEATSAAVAELVREAIDVYRDDAAARGLLEGYANRLEEPLRIAVAGMVKSGKSTLLNAIIGEEIAATDSGDSTRMVTWYRYGETPGVTIHLITGETRAVPVERIDGRLVVDIGVTLDDEVDRLVVDWPAETLRNLTLIDTPGIAALSGPSSARTTHLLTPEGSSSEADAMVYVMRHLHAADLDFLGAFRDTAVGQSGIVNALAVLSRADEIGAGRIDSLLSAREIAKRYRRDASLRALVLGVVPIAGLLAQNARHLSETELATMVELARLDRNERERLLISVDRFVRPTAHATASADARAALLDRFGLFGIRLATVLIRSGITERSALADELARRSGLNELRRQLSEQFQVRAALLKARTALGCVEILLRDRPREGSDRLHASIERIHASAHEFREMRLLTTVRTIGLHLAPELTAEVERLVGAHGYAPAQRLGMAEDTPADELRSHAVLHMHRWRIMAENPLTNRATAEVCETVVRSCEAILVQTQDSSSERATARLVLGPEPTLGAGQHADDQPSDSQ